MNPAQLQDLLRRYQQGNCTPEERQVVEAWYEELGVQEKPALLEGERQLLQADLWKRIAHETVLAGEPFATSQSNSWWRTAPVRWAAAALLAVGLGTAGLQLTQTPTVATQQPATTAIATTPAWSPNELLVYTNSTKQPATIRLPDGSMVFLSPNSRLQYPQQFTGPNRQVYLTGEASFDVQHDAAHPFRVYTDKLVTTVLGTLFTVRSYSNQSQVLVKVRRGKVRVTPRLADSMHPEVLSPTLASLVVRPNQQAVYSAKAQELTKELVAQPAVLVNQPFAFDDRPVSEVLAALEKAYGVDIVYDENKLANCTVSLALKDESLFNKLAILCKTLGASYELLDMQIVIHSQGCKS
jgi:transmembrane sensor